MKKILIGLAGALLAIMSSMSLAQAPVDDSEIVSILTVANKGEVSAAKNAEKKAANPEVRKFAQLMITDHQNALKQTNAIAKKAGIQPINSGYARGLRSENLKTKMQLRKLQGNSFDQAYMDSQIKMHQDLLDMIDKTLLPGAKNAELKALITSMRPVIEGHLQQAKQIRSTI